MESSKITVTTTIHAPADKKFSGIVQSQQA